jgi:transcription initiation factor TFIIIB Brf1 subunit/transcription initiation factor TFIIB
MAQICKDCSSDRLVIHTRDGDLVCTQCGLVNESRMIVEDYLSNHDVFGQCGKDNIMASFNNYDDTVYHKASIRDLREMTEKLFGFESCEDVTQAAVDLYDKVTKAYNDNTVKKTLKHKKRLAIMASCIQYICMSLKKGMNPEVIYSHFGVPLWQEYSTVCQYLKDTRQDECVACDDDMISRMVASHPAIHGDKSWQIIQAARQLKGKVDHILTNFTKSSKLSACFIYIACKTLHLNVSKASIQTVYGVSSVTLLKHEKMIQKALSKVDAQ